MIARLAEGLVVAGMTFAGFAGGSLIGDIIKTDISGMRLISLEYNRSDGTVTQVHEIYGVDVMQAAWAANVTRGNKHICSGGGIAPYKQDNQITMSLNEWVGDECPALKNGDKIIASWVWWTSDGLKNAISGSLVIAGID